LTSIVKEFAKEIGKEIKDHTELNGRTDSNLIDTLNASYNLGFNQEVLTNHAQKNELYFTPF